MDGNHPAAGKPVGVILPAIAVPVIGGAAPDAVMIHPGIWDSPETR